MIERLQLYLSNRSVIAVFLFLTGALYPLGFAPFSWWWMVPISLTGLLLITRYQSPLGGFKTGFLWGLGMNLVGSSWVWVSIHRFGGASWWGAGLLTLLFVAYLACFKGLFTWLCGRLGQGKSWFNWVLITSVLWVGCEWLQSWLLTGFPWLLAGYSQMDAPLAGIAAFGGVKWLSWWLALFCALIVALVFHKAQRKLITVSFFALTGCALLLSNWPIASEQFERQTIRVSLVQPNVDQARKWDRRFFRQIIDDLYQLSEDHWDTDLLIWPEGAIPAYYQQVPALMTDLAERARNHQTHLIFGIPWFDERQRKSYVALQALGAEQQNYFKQVLVPFGEYVPLEDFLRGLIRFFDLPMSGFSLPASSQKPMQFNSIDLLPAICYEVAYPNILWQLMQQAPNKSKPKIIVTVSNDAWFGDSLGPYQHQQMARMRALELGVPLVRATNNGITLMTDAKGGVVAELPRHQRSVLSRTLNTESFRTPYRILGDWLLLGCVFLTLVLNIKVRRKV